MATKYEQTWCPDRKKALYVHRVVMEERLGRALEKGECVHHLDGDCRNNDPENLALASSHKEHAELEQETRALAAGAPKHYRRCRYCKEHDHQDEMTETLQKNHTKTGTALYYHRRCAAAYQRGRRERNKGGSN